MKITVVILTYNEEVHLERCLLSVLPVTPDIYVIDSFSNDKTVEIAAKYSAKVLQNKWENNHATQFNWALERLPADSGWVIRLDADEVLDQTLINSLNRELDTLKSEVAGVYCDRMICFQGQLIRFGGVGKNKVIRIFKHGMGRSEARWMDEHIKVDGLCVQLPGAIIDNNLNSLAWWIAKHNNYSSREAVDLLNLKYGLFKSTTLASNASSSPIGRKRWIKENVYTKIPSGLRAFTYFIYRYIFRLGFLDGSIGTQFHFLQAWWYRYLVDAKIAEVERYSKKYQMSIDKAIYKVLGIQL
jgi:glycosyltransferase involved in cell wall biosynthesis